MSGMEKNASMRERESKYNNEEDRRKGVRCERGSRKEARERVE